ncbi:hypothetical protein SGLAM104S_03890 [Streptomyces glaucescens]
MGRHGTGPVGVLARLRGPHGRVRTSPGRTGRLVAARRARRRGGARPRRRRPARAVLDDGLPGRGVALLRCRTGGRRRAFAGRGGRRLRGRRAVPPRRDPGGRPAQPRPAGPRGHRRHALDRRLRGMGARADRAIRRARVDRRGQRPQHRGRLRRPGRPAGARRGPRPGRRHAVERTRSRLLRALRPHRAAGVGAGRDPRRGRTAPRRGAVLLHRDRRAPGHRGAGRRLLVPQPARPGPLRGDRTRPGHRRTRPVRRGQPPSHPHHGRAGDLGEPRPHHHPGRREHPAP